MGACHHHRIRAAGEFHRPDAPKQWAPDLGLEPTHLDVEVALDLTSRSARSTVTTTVTARRAGERTLALDAVQFLDVSVRDPDQLPLIWSYDGRRISITWDEAPEVGQTRRVEVCYRVETPPAGMIFSTPDDERPDRPLFVCTDHETERARYWLPCVDHPSVRTTLDLHVTAPKKLTILANGERLRTEDLPGDLRTVHHHLDLPCPSYLICLAAGNFSHADGGQHGGIQIDFWGPPDVAPEDLVRTFGPTASMLAWMEGKLGLPHPFPKYDQLAVAGIGGAMENVSLVTWDDAFLLDANLERDWRRLIDRVNVHEMAHGHFGDSLVIRDFAHAWLKESWATYMEALWVEDEFGEDEFLAHLHHEARDYMEESDDRYARPIVTHRFDGSWDMFDQHLYPGGAWRLHMLRRKLGDQAFFSAVQDYVRRYRGQVVETSNFRRILERHCGLSLGQFFDQWLESPGYPKLKVELSWDQQRSEAKIEIDQTQIDEDAGIGTFTFDLDLELELADDTWHHATVGVREARHTVVVPLASSPRQVVVDPHMKVLARIELDAGKDVLTRMLEVAPLNGRIQAAEALADDGGRTELELLVARFPNEPSRGVRIALARAIATVGTLGAARALAQLLSVETDSQVLTELATAAGRFREPDVAEALARIGGDDDASYLTRAAALGALGGLGGQGGDHFDPPPRDRSRWGFVQRGALAGLGRTREAKAISSLTQAARDRTQPEQLRTTAILALGGCARWQERETRGRVLDTLEDLARDQEHRIRAAVATALTALGAARGADVIETIARQASVQEIPHLQRMATTLRQSDTTGGPGEKLEKRVERLESHLRKLLDRVDTLESR